MMTVTKVSIKHSLIEYTIALLLLVFLLTGSTELFAQTQQSNSTTNAEQEIINLSKQKWQWMAAKNVDKLAQLFDDQSKFVHMSGTWKKDEELDIIKTGTIWYRKADVHDVAVEMFGTTSIIWSRITLESTVRDSEAKVEFTVTEVYQKRASNWKLLALTFSSVRDTHVIKH